MTQQGQALPGYFISLALVIQYPHFICRKLSATRDGSRQIENDFGYFEAIFTTNNIWSLTF
jgi:hypothetical protein